jgi:hypothetical protein
LRFASTEAWTPAIGDPTFMGWLITAAYAAASIVCVAASSRRLDRRDSAVRWFWIGLSAVLVFLAANKQLDLQSLLTAAGRDLFKELGWYGERREVQRLFMLALGGAALVFACFLFWRFRWEFRSLGFALAGIVFLLCFILLRAASFHHVDDFLSGRLAGVRVRSFLELAGIALVMVGAFSFLRKVEE